MLTTLVYPIFSLVIWGLFGMFLGMLILRMIFNYTDPNPFGKVGRFGFKVRKVTERWVYPAARFFAMYRIDTRLAPLLTMFIGLVITYFGLHIVWETFSIVDRLGESAADGNVKAFAGFVIYAILDLLILFIFIRFLASWFVFTQKTFLGFVMKVTNPVMLPVQRLIPPIGMFDISAMIVLLLIGFLQTIVINIFVRN